MTTLKSSRSRQVRLAPDPDVRELLEPAQGPPPVLPSLVLGDAFKQVRRAEPHVPVLVEQAEGDVKQAGVGLGRDAEEQADLVVRVDVPRKGRVDLLALLRAQALRAEPVVHVVQVEALERADRVQLRDVLRSKKNMVSLSLSGDNKSGIWNIPV